MSTMRAAGFRYAPDTLARIRAWVRGDHSPDWIARQLGCTLATLVMICDEHGIALRREPGIAPPSEPPLRMPDIPTEPRLDTVRRKLRRDTVPHGVDLARDAADAFAREAARRGTNVTTLAAVILEIVATDALFAAVLDN